MAGPRGRPRCAYDQRHGLVRDDGRAALRAARDQHRPLPLAATAHPRRADRERQPALPAPAGAALPRHTRPVGTTPRAPPQRLRHELGEHPGVPAGPQGDAERSAVVFRGGAERLHPLDRSFLVPDDRGRRLSGLCVDGARAAARSRIAARPERRPAGFRSDGGDARADAVRGLARRAGSCAVDPSFRLRAGGLALVTAARRCARTCIGASRAGRGICGPCRWRCRPARRGPAVERIRHVFRHGRGRSASEWDGSIAAGTLGADRPRNGDPALPRRRCMASDGRRCWSR